MGFFGYLILGAIVYVAGFMINVKFLKPKRKNNALYSLKTPVIWQCVLGCFVIMLIVSVLLSLFVLGHKNLDIVYVLVNSTVASTIFYFGLNPDEPMDMPK